MLKQLHRTIKSILPVLLLFLLFPSQVRCIIYAEHTPCPRRLGFSCAYETLARRGLLSVFIVLACQIALERHEKCEIPAKAVTVRDCQRIGLRG